VACARPFTFAYTGAQAGQDAMHEAWCWIMAREVLHRVLLRQSSRLLGRGRRPDCTPSHEACSAQSRPYPSAARGITGGAIDTRKRRSLVCNVEACSGRSRLLHWNADECLWQFHIIFGLIGIISCTSRLWYFHYNAISSKSPREEQRTYSTPS